MKVMINDKANEVTKDVFESRLSRYQIALQTSMKDVHFVFDSVNLLYYKYHKINLNHGGSDIYSPCWIKSKNCFFVINKIYK